MYYDSNSKRRDLMGKGSSKIRQSYLQQQIKRPAELSVSGPLNYPPAYDSKLWTTTKGEREK